MRVLMTGATGFVGRRLAEVLIERGHTLVILSRAPERARASLPYPCSIHSWHAPFNPVPPEALEGVEGVIHLAGEPVSRRWTSEEKKRIYDSRVSGTLRLVEALRAAPGGPPGVLVSASAIGYYGDRGDEWLSEDSSPGKGFLAEVCQAWEGALRIEGVRVVRMRTGIALGLGGGALASLLPVFRSGIGGPVGSGKQWMSWIHLEDLIQMYAFALENPAISGPLNAVAPHPVTNAQFSQVLAHSIHRPSLIHTPALVLKLAMGEMASIALDSQRVSCGKALELGFRFVHSELEESLASLFHAAS